jgi:hypothetical protein
MPERKIFHSGITCPDCGQDTAYLEVFGEETSSPYLVVLHPNVCQHFSHFSKYLENELRSQGIDLNSVSLNDRDLITKTLSFTTDNQNLIPQFLSFCERIQKLTNNFFTEIKIENYGDLESTVCPICGGNKYLFSSNNCFTCEKGHYAIRGLEYLKIFLQEHFYLLLPTERAKGQGQPTDENFCIDLIPADDDPRFTIPIALIIRRYTANGPNLLIVSKNGSDKDYQKFVDLLKNDLAGLFTIIVKIE